MCYEISVLVTFEVKIACDKEVSQSRHTYIQLLEQFTGLHVIRNRMQYKCTIGRVAVQIYAVVHCDIES